LGKYPTFLIVSYHIKSYHYYIPVDPVTGKKPSDIECVKNRKMRNVPTVVETSYKYKMYTNKISKMLAWQITRLKSRTESYIQFNNACDMDIIKQYNIN
jgi:hypothetical protein